MNARDDASSPNEPAWHDKPAGDVLAHLKTTQAGLTESAARARLAAHGPNRLSLSVRRNAFVRFALQFHNVLIYVLLGSAVITATLDHWVDSW